MVPTAATSKTSERRERQARQVAFGQNFLHSRRLVERLVGETSIEPDDIVIEIGPGKGIITDALAFRCRHVLTIEKDPQHAEIMRNRYADRPNVTVFGADVLEFPLPITRYKVFSNIPYNITAAIVGKLTTGTAPPEDAWLIVQREAADRFMGYPRETLQSVALKPWFHAEIIHQFRRQDFAPMPKVESVLLHLSRIAPPQLPLVSRERYEALVTTIFSAWKPTVIAALESVLPGRYARALHREFGDVLERRPSETPGKIWIDLFNRLVEIDDPRVWRRCHEAAERLRMQQSTLQKRAQTSVRHR